LIALDNASSIGDVIDTTGYSVAGDGGGGQWVSVAATGAASQSPSQLGDALLNDANGNQWALVKGVSGDIRKVGASAANVDNYLAIIAMHNSLDDGDTLLIPDGVFLTSAVVTTKRLNHVITGELRRSSGTTITDSVLEIQGDRSTLYGGGVVSWNAGAGSDTGRGEAIRLSGDSIYANNITGADTFGGTGNAWYVSGVGCVLDSCRGLNSTYAGVRSNMSAVDGDGEPTGQITIINFIAINCRRGWVNNGFADCITISNFQVKDLPVDADVQLLGETGANIKFNKLIIIDTFIKQNLSAGTGSLVKFVGIKEVNLTNCDFDVLESSDVDALTLQNEHAGTETYQENTLNATQCRFRSYNTTVLNVDHQEQWRLNTKQCQFIVDLGVGRNNMIDIDAGQYWRSVDDTFECQTSATTYAVRVEDVGSVPSKRFSFIRPRFKGQALSYFIGFSGTEFNIGQFQISDPKFDTQPTSTNWMFNSSTRDPKVIISDISLGKDTGRSFSALASAAAGLSAADYEQGDRVHIKDVGDTGVYVKIKGSTVWRDLS
jgi:hypothetical protein